MRCLSLSIALAIVSCTAGEPGAVRVVRRSRNVAASRRSPTRSRRRSTGTIRHRRRRRRPRDDASRAGAHPRTGQRRRGPGAAAQGRQARASQGSNGKRRCRQPAAKPSVKADPKLLGPVPCDEPPCASPVVFPAGRSVRSLASARTPMLRVSLVRVGPMAHHGPGQVEPDMDDLRIGDEPNQLMHSWDARLAWKRGRDPLRPPVLLRPLGRRGNVLDAEPHERLRVHVALQRREHPLRVSEIEFAGVNASISSTTPRSTASGAATSATTSS